jgi:DNA-binding transcriptional MerR regulator
MRQNKDSEIAIPNKLYFRIGEVSDLVGVKPYVLRYWESEFTDIKPSKSKSGQRLYKRRDVEMLVRIKELLYEERFTINGARKRLKDFGRPEAKDLDTTEEMEIEVPHVAVPKQLNVFETRMDEPEIKETRISNAAHVSIAKSAHESTKVLIKIRRDLETLLEVVKGG